MTLSIEDRLTIHEILARLDHAVDASDWDTYLSFYTDDATMDPGFAPPVSGRDAIREFLEATEGNTRGKRHVATNVVVDGGGNEATARSYLTVIEREDIPRIVATAVIEDTLTRHEAGWQITGHVVRVDPGMFKAFETAQAQASAEEAKTAR